MKFKLLITSLVTHVEEYTSILKYHIDVMEVKILMMMKKMRMKKMIILMM